ncbi:hypothetical protein [Flaviflagellibacter deserti]|uniref:Uncharacterized protein n=1 Tax=Flaviflagellibacter deserti TaxID=2267266 RepID=A0ABV9YYA2_9HYPH
MSDLDRRSAITLGLAGVSGILAGAAAAQTYAPTEGKELAPGVRQVDLGEVEAHLPTYKSVKLRDIVFQPGAKLSVREMSNDMVCHMTEGELRIKQGDHDFTVKKNDVYACTTGISEEDVAGSTVAIMRVIDLLPS